ncbi:Helix-turn-helix domain-containing protein [Terriglobus roseus]|uniref:Helix-turn-helix domain-containing protein n=2 Tax=Terriglobus roseus TaxID=392734 RepID=A0A1H4N3H7_9BACT|nr:Helix-turn-helix domain-containing protein [Terriglobus roseus]
MVMTSLQELQRRIVNHATAPTTVTAVPGLSLYHADSDAPLSAKLIYTPMVCIMAQGEKKVLLGDNVFRYTPESYLISSIDLPVTGRVCNAAPGHPYLALSLAIDTRLLSELLMTLPPAPTETEPRCGLAIGKVDDALLDCFVRLTRLLEEPGAIATVAPLISREILYRLLQGDQAQMLRQIATQGSRTVQVARAVQWIREHYAEPFSAQALAQVANMSPASLHRHFRAITAMSPLQYQKQVRLQEARRLLVTQGEDAATAGFHVGYASPSQFSREYTRTFGKPPRQDAASLQSRAGAVAVP